MKKSFLAPLLGLALCGLAKAATLTIACGSGGSELALCKLHAEAWARSHGHQVRTFSQPGSANEALAQYRQLLAGHSDAIDVLRIDTVWPGVLKDHLVDLRPYVGDEAQAHFPALIANDTLGGRLVALPWYVDAGVLYYRSDLLKHYKLAVPRTWAELEETARKVQAAERAAGRTDFYGFIFQGKAYEGLSCNALEWVASEGGGSFVEPDGRISANNPKAAAALTRAAGWVGSISPRGVLNYEEEDARGVFQNGQALFLRSWPYVWKLTQTPDSAVLGRVGVAALPGGAATLGGWHLAVSRYSRHPELAADLARYMTSAAVQKRRALDGGFNPSRPALYEDAEIQRVNPFMASLGSLMGQAVLRPAGVTGLKYPAVSKAVWDTSHAVLSGESDAADALRQLENRLLLIRRYQW